MLAPVRSQRVLVFPPIELMNFLPDLSADSKASSLDAVLCSYGSEPLHLAAGTGKTVSH